MKKNLDLIPRIALWVLMLIGIIVAVMFYVGGSNGSLEVAGDFLDIPVFTDLMLNWVYILLGLVILATLVAVCWAFALGFQADKKAALKKLGIICIFVLVLVIAWILGSPAELPILGYEGTDNVGNWAKMADATMYSVYILLAGTIIAIIWGAIYTRVKK